MGLNDDITVISCMEMYEMYYEMNYISVYSIVMIIRVRINIYHNQIRKV